MTRGPIAGGAIFLLLVAVALIAGCGWEVKDGPRRDGAMPEVVEVVEAGAVEEVEPTPPGATTTAGAGLLYGRVETDDVVYEGRLRFGSDEEALWGHAFNGVKDGNAWVDHVPSDLRPSERRAIEVLGVEVLARDRPRDLGRPFMARFGDIARIDPRGAEVVVTLKSGTRFVLDRFSADDLADGLRVWDARLGVVDLGEWTIRSIEFLPVPESGSAPAPLHGTVRAAGAEFTGLIQWDREQGLALDELHGLSVDGEVRLRFDAIEAIRKVSGGGVVVTLHGGGERALSGTRQAGPDNRGLYVDDARYGRVLVSWDAFERVDFMPGGDAPGYDDFMPGRFLTGVVSTRSGERWVGRLVYDLDESETTETLDAPLRGVDYSIPFDLIAAVVPGEVDPVAGSRVELRTGEALSLEGDGDLGPQHGGMLVFVDGESRPVYVPWAEVARVAFDAGPGTSSGSGEG